MLRSRALCVLTGMVFAPGLAIAQTSDVCANAPSLGLGMHNYSTVGATGDSTLFPCFTSEEVSTPDVWFKHTAGADGFLTVNTCASPGIFGMLVSAYDGCGGNSLACTHSYLLPGGCSPDWPFDWRMRIHVTNGQTIWFRVANPLGTVESTIELTMEAGTPPANDTCAGATAMVLNDTPVPVDFANASPLLETPSSCSDNTSQFRSDLWFKYSRGSNPAGVIAASPCFTEPSALTVFDACGGNVLACHNPEVGGCSSLNLAVNTNQTLYFRLTGLPFIMTGTFELFELTPTANDACAQATPITPGVQVNFDVSTATFSASDVSGGVCFRQQAQSPDVWYTYVPQTSGTMVVDSPLGADIGVYTSCGSAPIGCEARAQGNALRAVFHVTANQPVLFRATTEAWRVGPIGSFTVSGPFPTPGNDHCSGALAIAAAPSSTPFDSSNATPSLPLIVTQASGNFYDVWYTYTSAQSGKVTFAVCQNTLDHALVEAYPDCSGNPASGVESLACGVYNGDRIAVPVTANVPVLIRVYDFDTSDSNLGVGTGTLTAEFESVCAADFNDDGTRDVADLFAYINAWLAKTPSADFNNSGNVDVADLFAYINAWLAGC